VVFGREEWEEVIAFFTAPPPGGEASAGPADSGEFSPTRGGGRGGGSGDMVNYVQFIEVVLDSSQLREVRSRLGLAGKEGQTQGHSLIRGTGAASRSGRSPQHSTYRQPPPQPGSARTPVGARGATVSFSSPDLFTGDPGYSTRVGQQPGRQGQGQVKGKEQGRQPLRRTTGGRYHSGGGGGGSGSGGGLYSPVVGGSEAQRRAMSPTAGRSSFGSSVKQKPTGRTGSGAGRENASTSRENQFAAGPLEDVKLTQKQCSKAKAMKFGNAELRALEDLKVSVSEALGRRPLPRGKSKADVLRDWLEMEDSNRSKSLSKNSVIATLNALGLPYEAWSTPSQRNLIDFLAVRGGGVVSIDDLMALIGAKL
jgi:hypothetical protein